MPFSECSLTKIARYCPYRVRLNPESEWFFVSLLARNRVNMKFLLCVKIVFRLLQFAIFSLTSDTFTKGFSKLVYANRTGRLLI